MNTNGSLIFFSELCLFLHFWLHLQLRKSCIEVFHLQCNYLKDLYKSGELELMAAIVVLAVKQNLSTQAKYQNKVQ